MKIATFNIDWASITKSKSTVLKITELLNSNDFDILILTEAIELNLPAYSFIFKTNQLPTGDYEGMFYKEGINFYRIIIYSKIEAASFEKVTDKYISICPVFKTVFGEISLYATIIGTLFNKKPFVDTELSNCIKDVRNIFNNNGNVCLAGDLNTDFSKPNSRRIISKEAKNAIFRLANECKMQLTTSEIPENIDHVFIPDKWHQKFKIKASTFIDKDVLSKDHYGIYVEIA